jgi:L,D-transpeptidase ErfK/SrfK
MRSHRAGAVPSPLCGLAYPAILLLLSGCQSLPSQWPDFWPSFMGGGRYGGQAAAPIRSDRFALPASGDAVVGQLQVLIARPEDTLADIARRHDLGYVEILQANPGVDPWLPGNGTRIILPTQFILPDAPRRGVVLNVASMRLFYYPQTRSGESPIVVTHPVGIGREDWPTPLVKTRVTSKVTDPAWYVPDSIRAERARAGDPLPKVVPPGPDNPLGRFSLRLAVPGYLIHGTNKPYGIGMRVSHGCIRLYPEDIENLFEHVVVGTSVRIVNQPYLAGWRKGLLYLEAHPPLQEDRRDSAARLEEVIRRAATSVGRGEEGVDWAKARKVVERASGFPVPVLWETPSPEQIVGDARVVRVLAGPTGFGPTPSEYGP